MRIVLVLPLCFAAAACSEPPPKKAEEAPAAALSAGQWELTREITRFEKMDEGAPRIAGKVGDKATASVCLAAADTATPPPELLTGLEDSGCAQDSLYLARGQINASYACSPKGLGGKVYAASSGTFTADTLTLTLNRSSQLPTDGDVKIDETLTGRRTGDCAAPGAAK